MAQSGPDGMQFFLQQHTYHVTIYCIFACAAVVFILLAFINAPYGRQAINVSKWWGPGINVRLAWFLLELPMFLVFGLFYFSGSQAWQTAPLILCLLWQLHYFHRVFIYPFRLRVNPGASYPTGLLLLGIVLNSATAYVNGYFIGELGNHLQDNQWLTDPRFVLGVLLFGAGFALNKHSDAILRRLRSKDNAGYSIPYGAVYRWVSSPNYLGEIIQWSGFALTCWSLPALAFLAVTLGNLLPRAISNHRWYKDNFVNYPASRKAIVPFVL